MTHSGTKKTRPEAFDALLNAVKEISDLRHIGNVLSWDQGTFLPDASGEGRGRQISLINRLAHEALTQPKIGAVLDTLEKNYLPSLPPDSFEACLLRHTRKEFERAILVPTAFVSELQNHYSKTYEVWTKARPANDFKAVEPLLRKSIELNRQYSEFFKPYDHIADPLIDSADPGMRAKDIQKVFSDLRKELVPLVQKVCAQPKPNTEVLSASIPAQDQMKFSAEGARLMGYDFNRGRKDLTHHPFMIRLGSHDVRITTRVKETAFTECYFSVIHEAGHALYELGIGEELLGTPLGEGVSQGIHESQSRLWENIVARSKQYWEFMYPKLQSAFPHAFGKTSLDTYYRAINAVERSLIRTESDELTYNLHVMIRFDLELGLLDGSIDVGDLPKIWNDRYESDLGIRPKSDQDGCMQDVHWYAGGVGGCFQGYTLGNIFSAQIYEEAQKSIPDLAQKIQTGQLEPLRKELQSRLYVHGSKFLPQDLIQKSTGSALTLAPYLRYLKTKFGALYAL